LWTFPSLLLANPLVWMVEVNGIIVDFRRQPRSVQERAVRDGLIPFIWDVEP
jgi:hypothetical protein